MTERLEFISDRWFQRRYDYFLFALSREQPKEAFKEGIPYMADVASKFLITMYDKLLS